MLSGSLVVEVDYVSKFIVSYFLILRGSLVVEVDSKIDLLPKSSGFKSGPSNDILLEFD